MAKRASFTEQLDEALEVMMANPNAPLAASDPRLRDLLEIATELTCRPTREFRDSLKADLQRGRNAAVAPETSYRVAPHLSVRGAAALVEFLQSAFAAEETARHVGADGRIQHSEIRIGDSVISAGDADEANVGPAPTAIHLYVPDADAVYQRAISAGGTSLYGPTDQDYGDREAGVRDRFGNHWYIATHIAEDEKRAGAATYIPAGLGTMTSYLHPHGASQLIAFLERAFGAEETFRAQTPDGTVMHAKVRIGESMLEMGEAQGAFQPMPTVYHLYVKDTDTAYRRAVDAGGVSLSPPADQPWGQRSAGIRDPGGNQWWINAPLAEPTTETPSAGAVTPFLIVRDVRGTARFLEEAFGAELLHLDRGGDPPHDHAELRIGTSTMMMGEAVGGASPTLSAFYLHVTDVDAAYERALAAGATSMEAPQQMPWGDRMAHVIDALGNSWFIAAR